MWNVCVHGTNWCLTFGPKGRTSKPQSNAQAIRRGTGRKSLIRRNYAHNVKLLCRIVEMGSTCEYQIHFCSFPPLLCSPKYWFTRAAGGAFAQKRANARCSLIFISSENGQGFVRCWHETSTVCDAFQWCGIVTKFVELRFSISSQSNQFVLSQSKARGPSSLRSTVFTVTRTSHFGSNNRFNWQSRTARSQFSFRIPFVFTDFNAFRNKIRISRFYRLIKAFESIGNSNSIPFNGTFFNNNCPMNANIAKQWIKMKYARPFAAFSIDSNGERWMAFKFASAFSFECFYRPRRWWNNNYIIIITPHSLAGWARSR